MTSYLNLLKINDRSPFDTSFEGDVSISDDLIVSDDATIKDLLTVNRIKAQELDVETNASILNASILNAEVLNASVSGELAVNTIVKRGIVDGDNYILMLAAGLDGINQRHSFLRFRSGGSPTSYAGLCFSAFNSNHIRIFNTSSGFYMGRSLENSTTPTNGSFTDNIMAIQNTTGNINIGSNVIQSIPKLTVTNSLNEESLRVQSYGVSPTLSFYRGQGTESVTTPVTNNTTLGRLQFYGRDSSAYQYAAAIIVSVDGEPNTAADPSDIPSRISFFTTLDGTNSLSERLTIKNDGSIGISNATPNASAILDVSSSSKGFLPPRLTTVQKLAISTPASGLVVYDTTLNNLCVYNGDWIELVESFSKSFLKLNRTSTLTIPGVIAWNTHIKNGSDFNFTNNISTFSVNTTGYYEINANFEFLNTAAERLIETLFERVTPSQLDISRIFTSCAFSDAADNFVSSHLQDIVLLTVGETYRFSFGSQSGSTADLTTNSKVIIKRIT